MTRFIGFSVPILAAIAAAAGCAAKPLQEPDAGGSGGAGSIDAGSKDVPSQRDVVDDPPIVVDLSAIDAPPEAQQAIDGPPPFTGVRSFVVTSQLQRDGGIGSFPTSHVFTMVLDADRRIAISGGGGGEGMASTFELLPGGVLHIVGSLRFGTGNCPVSSITYDDLRVAIDARGGLTGAGRGQVFTLSGDIGFSAAATMSLTGVADSQPPTLTLSGGASDPFVSFSLVPSEPLPPGAALVLRAAGGESLNLIPSPATGGFVTLFQKPATMLRYATQYQITADGIADFAGNAASASSNLTFTTRALPPLAAEDGFESVTDATFGGVQVLSGAGAPTLTGTRSLYVPPTSSPVGMTQPQFLVRLSLTAGDTAVRFAYRTVTIGTSTGAGISYGVSWQLGSEGGMIAAPALPVDNGATTPATIGGAQVSLGPLTTATFTLPPDAAKEIALQRTAASYSGCGGPPQPPIAGIIIDDLRAD